MRFRKKMTMMSDAILELECLQISSSEFIDTARQLVSAGKGLLAMDESTGTCNERSASERRTVRPITALGSPTQRTRTLVISKPREKNGDEHRRTPEPTPAYLAHRPMTATTKSPMAQYSAITGYF